MSTPIKNNLLFQFNGNQTVVKISLKCVKTFYISVTLKETATKFLPFKNNGETVYRESDLPINNATVYLERTLSNEYWNSFCVPFNITPEQITQICGGGEVLEFSNATRSSVSFKTVTTGIRAV